MSVPPDILSQILQGGLLNYGSPNALDTGLLSGSPSTDLGMQLLANSNTPGNFGGILGRSMLGMQDQQQKNAGSQLDLLSKAQQMRMQAMQQQMFMQAYPAYLSALGVGGGQVPQGQTATGVAGAPGAAPGPAPGGPPMAPGGVAPPSGPQGLPQTQPQPQSFGGASGQQPDPLSMVRMGAIGAALGMPGAKEMLDAGKTFAQYNPTLQTQMKAAESEISQLVTMRDQAAKGGDYDTAAGINHKLQETLGLIHVGSMNGNVTQFNPGGGFSTFNPSTGIGTNNGRAGLIPGMAGALQQKEAAEATGRAAGEVIEATDAQGNKYYLPKTAALGFSRPAGAATATGGSQAAGPLANAGGTAPGPLQAGIGPGQETMLKQNSEQAGKVNEAYQSQVEAGTQMLTNTAELRHAAADFGSGKFAENRANFLDLLNSAGLITPDEKNKLGSAQVGQKIAIQLQAAATKQLGSREAAQIFSIMGKSLPNLTLSPDGLEKVSAYLDGMARYNITRGQVAQQRMSANDSAGVNNVRGEFVQNTNPMYFIVASAAPDQQKEMLDSMGSRKMAFLKAWNQAANNGWAPRPGQYNNGP